MTDNEPSPDPERFAAPAQDLGILSIWVTPEGEIDGTPYDAFLSIELIAGPKRYMRVWPDLPEVQWGHGLHPSAVLLWSAEPRQP